MVPLLHRRHAVDGLDDAGLHIKDAWATPNVAFTRKWSTRHRAEWKHRVVMPDDEHLGVVAALPMHVWATVTCNQHRRRAQYARHEVGKKLRTAREALVLERW